MTESFPQVTTLIRYQLLQQEWGREQKKKNKRAYRTKKSRAQLPSFVRAGENLSTFALQVKDLTLEPTFLPK